MSKEYSSLAVCDGSRLDSPRPSLEQPLAARADHDLKEDIEFLAQIFISFADGTILRGEPTGRRRQAPSRC
jgi:hypothetical protein